MLTTAQSLTDAQKSQARSNIGAAPENQGIGGVAGTLLTANDDLNDRRPNGLYQWAESIPANAPTQFGQYCMMWVYRWGNFQTDVVWGATNYRTRIIRVHTTDNSKITEYWENPPMNLGVEYRTAERYLGKLVYAKVIDLGTLTNNTTKTVDAGITNMLSAVSIQFIMSSVAVVSHPNITKITFNDNKVSVATNADMSGWTSCRAICKYTKTTD